eukprot:6611544-Pyramimonas_sp.AAC.1
MRCQGATPSWSRVSLEKGVDLYLIKVVFKNNGESIARPRRRRGGSLGGKSQANGDVEWAMITEP